MVCCRHCGYKIHFGMNKCSWCNLIFGLFNVPVNSVLYVCLLLFLETVISFAFSERDYRASERINAVMPVKINLEQNVQLANPVTFKISPLTVADAQSRSLNVPADAEIINPYSPVQAGKINNYSYEGILA